MKTQPTADMLARHPREFWEAVDYFHRNRLKIRKRYKDGFVAILDDRVIDDDSDYGTLAQRCREQLPDRDPYLAYAAALSLEEMFDRFPVREDDVDVETLIKEAEIEEADEFIRRMQENAEE